jgi:antitoxin ParD1/3/4
VESLTNFAIVRALRKAIKEGIDSGVAKDFNPKKHLAFLKKRKKNNV